MIEREELQKSLRKFNTVDYADSQMSSETAKYKTNGKGGLILTLKKDENTNEGEFYGGQPYSGNETIWQKEVAVFRCVY